MVYFHGVPCRVIVSSNQKPIFIFLISHLECSVLSVCDITFKVFQINSQLHLFCGGQTVKIVVSKPELTTQITKPRFLGCAFAIEVNRSIHPSLKHGPASTLRHHVTQNLYWLAAIWNDGIYTTGSDTLFTKL